MMERINRILLISGTFLCFIILLYGCAAISKKADPEESLKNNALNYWKMRIEGKYEDAYKMEDMETLLKGNSRGLPLNEYKDKAMITSGITSYDIERIRIRNNRAMVDMVFTFTNLQMPRPFKQILTDDWILKDGKWLHLFPE